MGVPWALPTVSVERYASSWGAVVKSRRIALRPGIPPAMLPLTALPKR